MKKAFTFLLFLTASLFYSQNYKYGKVSIEELKETECSFDKSASASVLYSERKTKFEFTDDNGFYIVEEYFVRMKIYTKEGYEYATETIPLYYGRMGNNEKVNSLKAMTYNLENNEIIKTKLENDAVFLEKTSENYFQKKFTMPNIKEGSVLEWTYTKESPFFTLLDDLVIQNTIPTCKFFASISVPEYFVYNTSKKGYYPLNLKTEKKQREINYNYRVANGIAITESKSGVLKFEETIYKVDAENIPAVIEEPFANNIKNYLTAVVFELSHTRFPNSTIETFALDWEAVVKTLMEHEEFGGQMKNINYVNDYLPEILLNKSTEIDKINSILKFIQSNIKYNGNQGLATNEGVKKALKEKTGNVAEVNINLLNFLKAAGLDAYPVIVSTINHGIPLFPSVNAFNYVIVSVNTAQGKVLLDATDNFSQPNILPTRVLNFNGREIFSEKTSNWIELYPSKYSVEKNIVSAKFNGEKFEGNNRSVYINNDALNNRNKWNGLTKEHLIDNLKEELEGVDILDIRISNIEDTSKVLMETYKFETETSFENISDKIYIEPLLFFTKKTNPFKLDKREYPIFYNYPWIENTLVNIAIPENYKIVSIPQSVEIQLENNIGLFQYKTIQNENNISIEYNNRNTGCSSYRLSVYQRLLYKNN